MLFLEGLPANPQAGPISAGLDQKRQGMILALRSFAQILRQAGLDGLRSRVEKDAATPWTCGSDSMHSVAFQPDAMLRGGSEDRVVEMLQTF